MRLSDEQARVRLAANAHGVLCTLHPERGPDPLPVVYAMSDDGHLGVPVDWSRLWWVRAHLNYLTDPPQPVIDDLTC